MTTSITAASASLITGASTSSTTSTGLVKAKNGEYTAASVAADPTDANKLGLVKQTDGNYGTSAPKQVAPSASSSSVSSGVQAALSTLTLGGS